MSCRMTPRFPDMVAIGVAALGLAVSVTSCDTLKPDACMAPHGIVILAGHVMRPPFEIEIIDSVLCVNGMWPARPESRVPAVDPAMFAEASLMYEVFREADSLRGRVADSVVIARAVARMRASLHVDSVRTVGFGNFGYWSRGRQWPTFVSVVENHHPGHRPTWDPKPRAARPRPTRGDFGKAVVKNTCQILREEGVAVIGGGEVMRFRPDDAALLMGEIDRARRGLPGGRLLPDAVRAELRNPVPLARARK